MLPQPAGRPAEDQDQPLAHGVETLCESLLPEDAPRHRKARETLRVLLGQAPGGDGEYLRWPPQGEVARVTGQSPPQVSTLLRRHVTRWLANPALSGVRDEIVALLDTRGAVMSGDELADALLTTRGSYSAEPRRRPQAIGLVRAAVEAELSRGGDARLAIHRFRRSDVVLVGREPDDPTWLTTAADLLEYVVRLGDRAVELAGMDPLPMQQRAG